jgi:membrane fusion protein (multidrug efflux system)
MKTKYIIYTLLALLVAFLIYNKFFSKKAKTNQCRNCRQG